MIKAIFMDFYGTAVHETGPIFEEVVNRVYRSGNARSYNEVVEYWWNSFRQRLENANGNSYRLQRDIAFENFEELVLHFQSRESARELCDLVAGHWRNPPIYDDTKAFLDEIDLPVYFVSNSDNLFIYDAIKNHDLKPKGIVTSEQARYSKPRKEIFLYALERTSLKSNEVIHVGDSIAADVICAQEAGIHAILLNRADKPVIEGIHVASNFIEVKEMIESIYKCRS